MNLNELKDIAYQCAVAHGWHEEEKSNSHWLCLVISELMEAVEADRKGDYAGIEMKDLFENDLAAGEDFKDLFEAHLKGTVEEELADACIRLLDFAGLRNLNLTYTNGFPITNMSFTEYIYCMCSFITNPDKSSVGWLDDHISYSLGWIFSWCRAKHINIEWYIQEKMKYNQLRSYKHGNKAY